MTNLKLAVVTGGHSYDVQAFRQLFRSFSDFDAYVQHMDDFCYSSPEERRSYDAVVFFIMLLEGPSDEGLPWYAGKPATMLKELGTSEQGIVLLHHALVAYPDSAPWDELVGYAGKRRVIDGYHHNQTFTVKPTSVSHPITRGLEPWELRDETYVFASPPPPNEILLTTDYEKSMQALAWTRSVGKSRVFCLQSGHDDASWSNPQFRLVLERGIRWSAQRLD
jgi:hypothetical protein